MALNQTRQDFLAVLSSALSGAPAVLTAREPENYAGLLTLAAEHKVLPQTVETLWASEPDNPALVPWTARARKQVAAQTLRTEAFFALYDGLRQAGFHPLVVKGPVCGGLYPRPELRLSADFDLLVPPEEFDACCEYFRETGLAPTREPEPEDFEIGWQNADNTLYIELHRQLFAPDSRTLGDFNALLASAMGQPRAYTLREGRTVDSLNPEAHLTYLLLHAYKHFIHSGFGIRQVMDIGLWAREYAGEIGWEKLTEKLREARALTFSAAVLKIARDALKISLSLPPDWPDPDTLPMLEDLLSGGVFGTAEPERIHAASVTAGAVDAGKNGKGSGLLSAVFPEKSYLQREYPYARRHPVLLPAAWAHRILRYGLGKGRPGEALGVARERIRLLKTYEIIDG